MYRLLAQTTVLDSAPSPGFCYKAIANYISFYSKSTVFTILVAIAYIDRTIANLAILSPIFDKTIEYETILGSLDIDSVMISEIVCIEIIVQIAVLYYRPFWLFWIWTICWTVIYPDSTSSTDTLSRIVVPGYLRSVDQNILAALNAYLVSTQRLLCRHFYNNFQESSIKILE